MGSGAENLENHNIKLLIMSLLAFGFLIASTLGVFDPIFDFMGRIQSGYRIEINKRTENLIDLFDTIGDISHLKSDRDKLQDEVVDLKSQIASLQSELEGNKVISEQISGDFSNTYIFQPAYIIRYKQEEPGVMEINKGGRDGVRENDIVVYKNYAIGEIVKVGEYTSEVRTILAPNNKIAVVSEKGTKGILQSSKGRELIVNEVLIDSEVKEGDDFFTVGKNSSYVKGLYVGEVESIQTEASNTTKTIKLKNEVNLNSLDSVFILKYEN